MNTQVRYIQITNRTNPDVLDELFAELWKPKNKFHLIIDTTGCDISLNKALSIKHVLDKHREQSKKYVDHTTLLLKSIIVKIIMTTALVVLRPERPVYIRVK